MKSRFLRGLAVCVALFGFILHRGDSLRALSSDLVISQVYGGGGNAGATYRNDFIEIFNRGTSSVSLSGKSVQYASAAGTTWAVTSLTSVTLAPGQYYLVQEAVGAGGTTNLPAPDASGGIAMSATAGKVALVAGTAALTGTCPTTGVIDFVGFGGANCFESAPTPVLTNTTAALRGNAGCTETDNNAGDFAIGAPTPRNTASSLAPCGGGDTAPSVTGTSPGNSATNTPVNSNVIITFSESVTATASAFSIQCPAGVPQGFTQSASPSGSITLDPTSNLPAGTTCTVTVTATQITDTDTADPPDQMAANFGFSFTTANPVDAAPSVIGTTPADGAPNVAVTSPIVINFSESVTASPTAFAVQCPAGTPQSFGQSASPAVAFTLTPASPLPYSTTCTVTVTADQIVDADANDPPDGMTSNRALSFTTAAAPPPGAGIVRINEVDADTPGTDTAEFIELYDGGVGNTSLKGLVVVFFDGTGTNSNGTPNTNGKQSYVAFDLDDYSTDAQGYFVMGNPGVAGATLTFLPGEFGLLQNGPDAVGLYIGNASDFPNGTLATTTNLQDAIVYGTDDPAAAGLEPLLNAGLIVNENATGNSQTQASQRCPNGMGGFRNTSNYYPGTPTPGADNTCPAPRLPSDVVISQIYGGGGNSGATYRNDFVELFNRGAGTVDLTGWSLQYASSTGSGWGSNLQPLGGTLGAGKYYLVALGSGGAVGASLPPANISGLINMAGGSGKIALVSSFEPLIGGCPLYDPTIKDFVGYGSGADCGEGSTTTASGSNTAALYRKSNGSIDTDNNAGDFNSPASLPIPRQTEPIIELGPLVLSRDPRVNGFNAPRDATIQVIFTEPVTVDGAWFRLTCASSGQHNSATFASSFGGQDQFITPNDNFIAGEQCTMTIVKDRVHDVDSDDFATNTDTLPADVSWSFTVASGAAPAYPASVHLTLGNPGNAGSDPANYLMEKPEFAVSYNRDLGRPNWVSWHLSDEWVGTLARVDTFRPDPQIPPDWYRVQSFDFSGSGFDRGHMTPNADRDKETSVPINQATFLMSNMVAQAPANNQGPWAALEGYLRTLADPLNVTEPGNNELYIVSGPAGAGGSGSANTEQNPVITTIADGHVTVPAWTWKVALVLPKGDDDMSRVTCSTRTIAVILPNTQAVNTDWKTYLKTVDEVEALSGYDLFSNLPVPFQNCIEARKDGTPALTLVKGDQMITFAAPSNPTYGDAPFAVSATGGLSGNPVTFAASGACTSGGFNGATITVNSAGTCTITASQAASAAYNAATDAIQTVTVSKAGPSFSNLTTVTIEAGTATTALGGIVSFGALVPTGSVTITLNGVTQTAAVGPGGAFSASFATALLAPSATPYLVGYAYSGDTNFTPAAGTGSVRVVDTVAPSIGSVSVSRSLLSPPNHKMIDITIGYQAADVTAAPVCSLSISSNESIDGLGDGNTSIDWQVIDPHHVQLRSERSGGGNGRLYTITIRCTDSSGNTGSATTTVTVPK